MNKHDWMQGLQVGDEVCDCRMMHLHISSLEEEFAPDCERLWKYIPDWLPYNIFDIIIRLSSWLCYKFNWVTVIDKTLILEDGAQCSAIHCCDPVDHAWKHECENTLIIK